jgi:predicted acetyltransferase
VTDYDLVTIDPDSDLARPYIEAMRRGLTDLSPVTEEILASRRELWRTQRLTAVLDGDVVAGTYRSWDVDLTLPGGGAIRADAISSVAVQATHRRRGILTTLITDDLRKAHAAGTPVAVLIASEALIYGRYGFGVATESVTWTVDTVAARLTREAAARAARIQLRQVTGEELYAAAPEVYRRSRRPGDIDRWDILWTGMAGIRPGDPVNAEPGIAVLARDADGVVQGALRYTIEDNYAEHTRDATAHVGLLDTATDDAHAALWGYLVDLDLMTKVRAADRAVDDPLPWLLTDRRAARQSARSDFLWTRILDVPAALAARRYERPGATVLEVHDPDGYTGGRFALEVAADGGATCTATTAPADVELPVAVLGSVWLGGTDLTGAGAAGLVSGSPEDVARAAALFRTTTAPWSSTWF